MITSSWTVAERISLDYPRFQRNLERIGRELGELAAAASPARKPPRIVIVTKYLDAADVRVLRVHGIGPLAESRADDLEEKTEKGEDPENWHFIGHLQRNKVGKVMPRIGLFHALDSRRLADAIQQWAERTGVTACRCLVEINVSGEPTKGGLTVSEAREEIPAWSRELPRVRISGLMTMAPLVPPEECRPVFRELRELRSRIAGLLPSHQVEHFQELSMGMSNDYPVAVQEGATLVRLGRALYE